MFDKKKVLLDFFIQVLFEQLLENDSFGNDSNTDREIYSI